MFEKVNGLTKLIDSVHLNEDTISGVTCEDFGKYQNGKQALVEQLVQQVTPKAITATSLGVPALKAPSRKKLKEILGLLRKVVFGASLEDDGFELRYKLGTLLSQVSILLEEEVYRALLQVSDTEIVDSKTHTKAREISDTFLETLPKVRMLILQDVDACFKGDPAAKSPLEIILAYPGIEAIFVYRVAHVLHQLQVPLVPRMMSEICHNRTAIDIHPGATIGCPFFIDHGTGVVIGETAVLGNNVTLFHNVTLGAISTSAGQALSGTKRHPTIEDDVTIYAGASVLGGKTVIGKGTVIGAGLLVCRSVPAGQVVKQLPQEQRYRVVPRKPVLDNGCGFQRDFSDATTIFARDESQAFGRMESEFGRMESDLGRMESEFGRMESDYNFQRMESDVSFITALPSHTHSDISRDGFSPLVKKNSDDRIALLQQLSMDSDSPALGKRV